MSKSKGAHPTSNSPTPSDLDDMFQQRFTAPTHVAAAYPSAPRSQGISTFQALIVTLIAIMTGIQLQAFLTKDRTDLIQLVSHLSSIKQAAPAPVSASKNATPIRTRFDHSDFDVFFGVNLLHTQIIDPLMAPYLEEHDITTDELYQSDVAQSERWQQQLGWFFENGLPDDQRFYVKFISDKKGYGVFAAVDVTNSQIVAEYTGVVTNNSISDYMWSYPSKIHDADGNLLDLGIDSRFRGNWARFVNHDDEDPNCDSIYMPYNNVWHVVYMTNRHIYAGEEVTVSYGPDYWASRSHQMVK
ncbi:hypothetical protein BC829DRAFT_417814 [Chytridium lagenaria]|nr:hypothetical protein BC829DRAFT_417814 [Chytridium lagenaria]